ncbi:MAG TPA: TIM-barrel domain-containing protein [Candidatus Acidoferrales bacterium]|nr:TIM-barrel domain-containing protein [Candidatus Acidoferrales bacterium]
MDKKNVGAIALTFLLLTVNALAAPENARARVEKTSRGLLIQLGQSQVELAPANANTLRLSVSLDGAPKGVPTTFLADTNRDNSVPWTEVERHGMVGIKTAAGKLLVNPKNGKWTLENAEGKTLIPLHRLGNYEAITNQTALNVTLGWNKHQPVYVYGCGNGTNSLEIDDAKTGLGNGVAVLPYYWAKAGYAVLAVTADDNRPAHWQAATDGKSVTWMFPGKSADLYLMPATTLKDAAMSDADLTGHAPVPPIWAFGYLQSRWGWADRAYIEDTLKKFHDLDLPVDAFIFDFEWYAHNPDYSVPPEGLAGFEDFGWNTNLFSDPAAQIQNYKNQGVHVVGIRKPRLGNPDSLKMMRDKHWALTGTAGMEGFQARDINFANPDVRDWYVAQSADLLKAGVDGWWNDEGEATFTTYYYWNLAEKKAFDEFRPAQRLWTVNRAFSPGLQRLGACAWTGDIQSRWNVLQETPASLLNWSLAGLPYETCDIGGFVGPPTPELLARWMEAGVFFPVMRTHSVFNNTPHFPWLFGTNALEAIRQALDLRYRLIPFYYSLAHETAETGLPLMRPLAMEFPDDPQCANLSDEWMMGSSLLAAPILTRENLRTIYLPDDTWYVFESNATLQGGQTISVNAGLDEIPVFVRAGTILPLGPVIQHTSELPGGPLELEIYPGKDAAFTLYEDDGETSAYLNGQVRRTQFKWNQAEHKLSWTIDGDYHGQNTFTAIHVVVFNPGGKQEADGQLNANGSLTFAK